MFKIFGIKIGFKCVCYSGPEITKQKFCNISISNNNINNSKKEKSVNKNNLLRNTERVINIHQPLSQVISDLSKSLYNKRLSKLSKKNKTRLDNIIHYMDNRFGEQRSREYVLMKKFLTLRSDLYLIAVEYEFDEGGCCIQQHGDMILLDKNRLLITECKCIELSKHFASKRQQMVKDQAYRCCNRFKSWINHLSEFDKLKLNVSRLDILPCTLTTLDFEILE